MKILLTGAEGFVGRHFQQWFSQNLPDAQVVCLDVKSGTDCRDTFRRSNMHFDLVVHLAAVVGSRLMRDSTPARIAVDLSIDAELWDWALRTRPDRIVYFSSCAAYPIALQTLELHRDTPESDIDLEHVDNPDLTYGWVKLTGEIIAKHVQAEGQRVHVFRPFSGYGADQDLDYPFPSLMKRARDKEDPFVVWGTGTQVRDFIHIDDVVAAVMEAVCQDVPGVTNLGWGRPTSMNELCDLAFEIAGFHPEVQHLLDKPDGPQYRCADNTKMLSFYKPKITLEEGIWRALS